MDLRSVCLILLLGILTTTKAQSEEGDACTHEASGKAGTCKDLGKCASAVQELKQQKLPQICGFSGTLPIVCCPNPAVVNNFGGDRSVGAKSKQMCHEYAKLVNVTYIPPVLIDTGGPVKTETRDECGFQVVPLIVGGTKAESKEFPHMAAIGYDSATSSERLYHCGGSLLSQNFVATAGHCLYSRDNGPAKYVRVGDLNLKTDTDFVDPQEFNIAQVYKHDQYKPPSQYNDIALLRIEGKVRFSAFVRPICLTTMQKPNTQKAIAIGWGKTGSFEGGSDHLLKVTLDLFDHDVCYNAFEINARKLKNGIVEDSQICAGSKKDIFKDTCPGDSGGPLQIFNSDEYCMYTLIGVTSFGKVCGASHSPAVYTRVAHYVDWIEKTVWP